MTQNSTIQVDTIESGRRPIGYWVATDDFLSGWGQAPGRSIVACPVFDSIDTVKVERRFRARREFKRVRYLMDYKTIRVRNGDHLHVYGETSFRYEI